MNNASLSEFKVLTKLTNDRTKTAFLNPKKNHELRVTSTRGDIVCEGWVALGSSPNARRVPVAVFEAFNFGYRIEVKTSKGGWEPRRVIRSRDASCYLRLP